jgi:hypothetical protein
MLNLNFKGAIVMLLFEYFVLLRLYKRSPRLEIISLIVAPLMVLVASYFAKTPVQLFVAFLLMELPLSLVGYKITPDASLIERLVVASTFGVTSSMIGYTLM